MSNEPTHIDEKLSAEDQAKRDQMLKEQREVAARMRASEEDFNKRSTINNMAFHLFGAMINGHISKTANLLIDADKFYAKAKSMATLAFEKGQESLDEGAKMINEMEIGVQ